MGYYNISNLITRFREKINDEGHYEIGRIPEGVVDGINKKFKTSHFPISNAVVYINNIAQTINVDYVIDTNSGIITFTAAPAADSLITIDYTWYSHSSSKLLNYLNRGIQRLKYDYYTDWDTSYSEGTFFLNQTTEPTENQKEIIILAAQIELETDIMVDMSNNALRISDLGTTIDRTRIIEAQETALNMLLRQYRTKLNNIIIKTDGNRVIRVE